MRRSFRIEAVGLLSLWFCFGSGVLAHFVVEWESGKEGCTMHVSPDQLWPYTKVLYFSAFGFVHKITTFEKTAGFQVNELNLLLPRLIVRDIYIY
ncbi:hypothetical protein ES332_D10G138800v1 [Gossypium tomentosum]|uniref:Uncharacterized protein n=1 Tax=Gossypium tomentosum TaxID=34277 RepID=A0A5D2J4G3_GOSTO|nr:hypothetical protein ES332_D10G138800v1 [Gossypium tomentosum]